MRILLAEDDQFLARGLLMALTGGGYDVTHAKTGADADQAVATDAYDLMILDLGLPLVDGLEVLRRVREREQTLPVLILTARHSIPDRVRGLDLGANDYLSKPFDLSELEARVRVLLRKQLWNNRTVITHGDLEFETTSQQVKVRGAAVDLTARETKLLEILLQSRGRVVTKQQLADRMCGWEADLTDNAIEILMHRLRKKLASGGLNVRTIRGMGYMVEKHE